MSEERDWINRKIQEWENTGNPSHLMGALFWCHEFDVAPPAKLVTGLAHYMTHFYQKSNKRGGDSFQKRDNQLQIDLDRASYMAERKRAGANHYDAATDAEDHFEGTEAEGSESAMRASWGRVKHLIA